MWPHTHAHTHAHTVAHVHAFSRSLCPLSTQLALPCFDGIETIFRAADLELENRRPDPHCYALRFLCRAVRLADACGPLLSAMEPEADLFTHAMVRAVDGRVERLAAEWLREPSCFGRCCPCLVFYLASPTLPKERAATAAHSILVAMGEYSAQPFLSRQDPAQPFLSRQDLSADNQELRVRLLEALAESDSMLLTGPRNAGGPDGKRPKWLCLYHALQQRGVDGLNDPMRAGDMLKLCGRLLRCILRTPGRLDELISRYPEGLQGTWPKKQEETIREYVEKVARHLEYPDTNVRAGAPYSKASRSLLSTHALAHSRPPLVVSFTAEEIRRGREAEVDRGGGGDRRGASGCSPVATTRFDGDGAGSCAGTGCAGRRGVEHGWGCRTDRLIGAAGATECAGRRGGDGHCGWGSTAAAAVCRSPRRMEDVS